MLTRAGVVLLAACGLLPCTAVGSEAAKEPLREEIAIQQAIYQTRGESVPQGYVIDRSLLAYVSLLPAGFDRALASLRPSDRWLDIGAGQGEAILDYYTPRYDAMHPEGQAQRGKKAHAVAMSIEDRRTARWQKTAATLGPSQIRYLHGKRLREYPNEELGKFKLITDLTGGFSYTRYLSVFIQKVLDILELHGEFYSLLLDVQLEDGSQRAVAKDVQLLTEIENADGSEGTVCSWLKSIACVQVTCEADTRMGRPIELYRIRKVCETVKVHALQLVSFQAGTPPQRRFSAKTLTAK
jgi:SAM-dependent methyltransferase